MRPPSQGQGDIPGLNQALLDLLRGYQPSEVGVCYVADQMIVTLPYPEWYLHGWLEQDVTGNIAATSSSTVVLYTVPQDERAWLDSWAVARASGDNDVGIFELSYPTGYFRGNAVNRLIEITPGDVVYWPDHGSGQTGFTRGVPGPVLLEPGMQLQMRMDGVGVAITTYNYYLGLRKMKVIRALVP